MAKLLLENGAEANYRTNSGFTALHSASKNNNLYLAILLLKNGAEVNFPTFNDSTPLDFAVENGHLEMAKLLLQNGANVQGINLQKWTPLHLASKNGDFKVAKLLLRHGVNVNCQNSSLDTPLHVALKSKNIEVLLQHDVNMDLKDENDRTAEDIASEKRLDGIVAQLINKRSSSLLDDPEQAISTTKKSSSQENSNECVICWNPRDGIFAFLPCYHAKTCEKCCIQILAKSGATCPFCRGLVLEYAKIFV